MSVLTGRDEVIRIRNEDMLVKEFNNLIKEIETLRDKCDEGKYSHLLRENSWRKLRDMQKILHKG